MAGKLTDTYVAAIQHDLADLPEGARRVGVVRKPTPWFHGAVDENRPALGPPRDLLEEFQAREEEFKLDGMCDEGAHNAAWEELDFEDRYCEYLETEEARSAVADLRETLADGTDVVLVCYENTDQKRCHRTILREELADARE
ncbi:DUF488 domain-containing protein [Halobacteria archaeon HArc-gm2]|nr:DUF488 domain-containing protein [Halobacteria archaeon HArc-gm2]